MAARKKARKPSRAERSERSQAIHTELDEAAAAINALHARVLASVIEARVWNIHRDVDGFSGLRDWLMERFDFHMRTAADLAVIARLSSKFTALAEAATSGVARIDGVAAAVRRLEKTQALRVYARAPYREPEPSPFDPAVLCPTPEHMVAQYCQHASIKEIHAHLDALEAALDTGQELIDGLGQQTLQRIDLVELDNGMWVLEGLLSAETGAMFAKALTTIPTPPRQDQIDEDGVLPAAANRRAEALHQILASHGNNPHAPTRHGQTCTLNLTVDIETLQGKPTGRVPMLEGRAISVGKARFLACETTTIPSVFNYTTGEAIELGRALRLPNTALRRKLELEQPDGCAWSGCGRPVQWTEAHHIRHWADGGATVAANLILLCRFHHGRIHTPGWTITKTGPGKALIVHHEDHDNTETETGQTGPIETGQAGAGVGCGCPDYRTAEDLDLDFQDDAANVFPTGLYPEEWSERLKPDLNTAAEAIEDARIEAELKEAKARVRARFTAPEPAPGPATATGTVPAIATERGATSEVEKNSTPAAESDTGTDAGARRGPELASLPVLPRPSWATTAGSEHTIGAQPGNPPGTGPSPMPGHRNHLLPTPRTRPAPAPAAHTRPDPSAHRQPPR